MKKWRYVVVQNWCEGILKIRGKNDYFIPDISKGIPDYDTYMGTNDAVYVQHYKAGLVCKRPDTAMRLAKRILTAVANGTLMTLDNNPLVVYRNIDGIIKCINCSGEIMWDYCDNGEIRYCPYCGQRINVVDIEKE